MSKISRRKFNKLSVAVLVAMGGFSAGSLVLSGRSYAVDRLRPPGALSEHSFLATCIKCGQCVQVCPYHSVKLLDAETGFAVGTPIIEAAERGCYLCDLLPCVLACPSGALDHAIFSAEQVHMGVAALDDKEGCLAYQNKPVTAEMIEALIAHGNKTDVEQELAEKLRAYVGEPCTLCRDLCPYPDRDLAITIPENYPVFHDRCVGCGVCEELCPTQVIKTLPRKTYEEVHVLHRN
jgi:MinD superfamily P-loop ATPase containing an inserted ferredoxin domain